jgi:hypothetical protein
MWMQAPVIFFCAVGFLLWMKGLGHPESLPWASLAFGLAAAARPTGIHVVMVFLVYVGVFQRRRFLLSLCFAAVPVVLAVVYNMILFAHPLGGYGTQFVPEGSITTYTSPFWPTLAVYLLSPSRGIFFLSPVLLLIPLACVWRQQNRSLKSVYLFMALPTLILIMQASKYSRWWGGASVGYRILIDFFPLLAPSIAVGYEFLSSIRFGRVIAATLLAYSLIVQGHLERPGVVSWNIDVDTNPQRIWSMKGAQWLYPWREHLWHRLSVLVLDSGTHRPIERTQLELSHKGITWWRAWTNQEGYAELYSPYYQNDFLLADTSEQGYEREGLEIKSLRRQRFVSVSLKRICTVTVKCETGRSGPPAGPVRFSVYAENRKIRESWDSGGVWECALKPGIHTIYAVPSESTLAPARLTLLTEPGKDVEQILQFLPFDEAPLTEGHGAIRMELVSEEGIPFRKVNVTLIGSEGEEYSGWDMEGVVRIFDIPSGVYEMKLRPLESSAEPEAITLSLQPGERLRKRVILTR